MSNIVRQSKYRHVFGKQAKKEECYEAFRPTNVAVDGNFIAANKKFIAVCIEGGGGGSFMVLPINKTGRLDTNHPQVSAHTDTILDIAFNPYNDNMLATCSADGTIKVWEIPNIGILVNQDDSKALMSIDYHKRKCTQISWHPIASSVLLSVSTEPKVCIWNLDEGEAFVDIDIHPDLIYNASWSHKGDKIVTSCKDKKFRVFDARKGTLLAEAVGHLGSKPTRMIFTMNDTMLFSTGFSKMSERQYAAWSLDGDTLKNLDLCELDTANNALTPYYDPDTQTVYLYAKGDSQIRYYELVSEEPYFYYIDTYASSSPQKSLAPILKRNVNVNACEIVRFYKLWSVKTGYIEPISFTVPRKSDLFQDDIFPPCIGEEAAIDADEWFGDEDGNGGKDVEPLRIEMRTLFKEKEKKKGGGGLKKGGLKGLKTKKEAKKDDASKAEPAKQEPAKQVKKADSPPPEAKSSPVLKKASATAAAPSSAPPSPSLGDSKEIKKLNDEVKSLKDSEKKMKSEVKSLQNKLKDYEKLTGDIKLLCDAVKKNDERIAVLEGLVESEEEADE